MVNFKHGNNINVIDRRMDKEYVVHVYSGILPSHQKNGIRPLAAVWMDLDSVISTEVSQTEKKYHTTPPFMWNLKRNDANDLTKEKETYRLRK